MPGRDPPGRKGEHRVRLVQGDESLDIPGIRPLEEQLAEVLRPGRRLSAGLRGHLYHHRFRWLPVCVILPSGALSSPEPFCDYVWMVTEAGADPRAGYVLVTSGGWTCH